jgi:hypothetical protein
MNRRKFFTGIGAAIVTLALPFRRRPVGPLQVVPGASVYYGIRNGWTGELDLQGVQMWDTILTPEQMAAVARNQMERFGIQQN